MANNCFFTYAAFMKPEYANELKKELSDWNSETFPSVWGIRMYISKPVGKFGLVQYADRKLYAGLDLTFEDYLSELGLDEEEIANEVWKEDKVFGAEMSLVVISGYERWDFPSEFLDLGFSDDSDNVTVLSSIGIAQVEGSGGFQLGLSGYSLMDPTDDDFDDFFDESFEEDNDGKKVYFKLISGVLDILGSNEEKPYHIVVPAEELSDFGLNTHFYKDKESKCTVADKKIRMIED